jgi:hypothetical protein
MGTRAEALAAKAEAAHGALRAAIERATPDEWRSTCTDGEWTKGYAAYHAAANIEGISGMAQRLANGQPPPSGTSATWDEINAANAQHASEHASCTPAEAVELLRRDGPAAVAIARALTDEQLDSTYPPLMAGMPELTIGQFVEMVMIGHIEEHLRAISGDQ